MTKQEEIREGLVFHLIDHFENNLLHNLELLVKMGEERDYLCEVADELLGYLHSQGVAILAPVPMLDRCSFVEPLIKGK